MIYILVPTFGQLERLNKCIKALEEKTFSDNVRLLISYENWNLGKPRGFTITANELIRSALTDESCSEIVMVNSDTEILTDRWLDKIYDYTKYRPDVGIVGPQEIMNFNDGEYWIDNSISPTKRKPGEGEILDVPYICFAFIWIRREVFDKVGILDMCFNPGYFDDFDFGVRTWLAGYRSVMLPNIQYRHARGGTFGDLVSKGVMKSGSVNWDVFFEKWKGIIFAGENSTILLNRLKELSKCGHVK